jgi:NAD(P)-dependent dehydrogenase (short-subunit alcohol dehydrogenase family)
MAGIEDLMGKTAVVTGGGNGIGAALCRRLVANGAQVVVSDVDAESAEKVASTLREGGGKAAAIVCDVSDRASVEAMADQAIAEFGRVDIVCNNAGVFLGGNMRDFTLGDWEWIISVNLMGVVNGATVFTPHLVEQGSGHILNTASIGGWASDPNCAPYTTSKFAVVGYSEALRADLAQDGIGVTILCPGPVASDIDRGDRLRPAGAGTSKASSKAAEAIVALGMPTDEVANLAIRGIRENATYVFTHPDLGAIFEPRIEEMRKALAATPAPSTGEVDVEKLQ